MTPRPRNGSWPWIVVAVYATVSRLAYLLAFRRGDPLYDYLLHDARRYDAWAASLARGELFEPGVYYQAPGYPLLLGVLYRLFGEAPLVGYVAQLLLGIVTILLVGRIAGRVFGERAGLLAASLAALYGVWPFYETKLLSASLSLLATAIVIDRIQAALERGGAHWWIAGLCCGLACWLRTDLILLVPAVAAWWLWHERREVAPRRAALRAGVALIAGTLIAIAPLTVRNLRVGGEWTLVAANGGVTFYQGNNPDSEGWFAAPGMSGSIRDQRGQSRALAESETGRPLTDGQVSRYWAGRGRAFLAEDPVRALRLAGRKAFFALDDHEHALEYSVGLDRNPFRLLFPLSFAWILGLAVLRGVAGPRPRAAEVPLLLLLAVQLVTSVAFFAAGRYRLPATVALLVLAGGVVALRGLPRKRPLRFAVGLAAAIVAVALSLLPLPPDGADRYRRISAGGVAALALAHERTGEPEEAVRWYREAISRDPDAPLPHLDLSRPLRTLGRLDEAEASLRQALDRQPLLAEAHFELGSLQLQLRRPDAAAEAFAEALRLRPGDAAAATNLLGCYVTLARWDEALALRERMRQAGIDVHPGLDEQLRRRGDEAGTPRGLTTRP